MHRASVIVQNSKLSLASLNCSYASATSAFQKCLDNQACSRHDKSRYAIDIVSKAGKLSLQSNGHKWDRKKRHLTESLQDWCRGHQAECLAVQLPGRNMRRSEPFLGSCQEVAQALFPVVASRLSNMPYYVRASICYYLSVWIQLGWVWWAQSFWSPRISLQGQSVRHIDDIWVGPCLWYSQ